MTTFSKCTGGGCILLSMTLLMLIDIPTSKAGTEGDDFAPPQPAAWWAANGATTNLSGLTAGGLPITYPIKWWYAKTALILAHCKDHTGVAATEKYKHIHLSWNFGDAGVPANALGDINRYWDDRFHTATKRSDANTQRNCHAYAFHTFIQKGAWTYWTQDAEVTRAYDTMTDAKAKAGAIANDCIYYMDTGADFHSTGILSVNSGSPVTRVLKWRWNVSGEYDYTRADFVTKNKNGDATEAMMTPAGSVRRAKP